ncbi:MAG: hypothetical protein J6Q22_11120 [Prevotella sp.]|nr:hypothetical protein [Prevotella sp.]
MEELHPIKTIKADFGKPQDFSPPELPTIWGKLVKEAKDIDEEDSDLLMAEYDMWHSSITEEQKKTYLTLCEKKQAAEKALKGKDFSKPSPESKAYYKAERELDEFKGSIGKHFCFSCSYYFYDGHFNKVGVCEYGCKGNPNKEPAFVRPSCIACKHYTCLLDTVMETGKLASRKPPARFADPYELKTLNDARHFCNMLKESPSTAFYLYQQEPKYYEFIYTDFPFLLAMTKYPSFPLFLEAYSRWKKDVIIKKELKEDREEITFSISDPEFAGTGLVPGNSCKTTDN